MSFEGYYRVLCKRGHQSSFDAYDKEPDVCRCGESIAWRRLVDQTNDEGYDPPLEVVTEEVREVCNMGHSHVVKEATYRIPDGW